MKKDLEKEFPNLEWKLIDNDNGLIYAHDSESGLGVYVSEDGFLDDIWNLHVYNKSYGKLSKALGKKEKILKAIRGFLHDPTLSFIKYIVGDLEQSILTLSRIASTDPELDLKSTIKKLKTIKNQYTKLGKEYGMQQYTKRGKRSNRKLNI